MTAGLVERAYHADRSLLPRLLEAPELAEPWAELARHQLRVRANRGRQPGG